MSYGPVDPYAHANPYFIRAVKSFGRPASVLDVGCWSGSLGRVLIAETGSTVDGVERDVAQADAARLAGYRKVMVIDLDRSMPPDDERYDFVIFGDILEHLVDSEAVLCTLAKRAKQGGRVLVSLPNIGFVVNRLTHLLGRWEYRDYGILDRTHLRFFTRKSMVALLEAAGLKVLRIDGYVGLHRYHWIVREPLRVLGRLWPSLFAIQIVLEAQREVESP